MIPSRLSSLPFSLTERFLLSRTWHSTPSCFFSSSTAVSSAYSFPKSPLISQSLAILPSFLPPPPSRSPRPRSLGGFREGSREPPACKCETRAHLRGHPGIPEEFSPPPPFRHRDR